MTVFTGEMERQPSELDENLLAPDNSNPSGEIGSVSYLLKEVMVSSQFNRFPQMQRP